MRRLHRGRKESQLPEVHDESLQANEAIDSEQNSHWSVKCSPYIGRWWQHAPSFAGVRRTANIMLLEQAGRFRWVQARYVGNGVANSLLPSKQNKPE